MKVEYSKLRRKMLLQVLAIAVIGLALWGGVQLFLVDIILDLPESIEITLTENDEIVLTADQMDMFIGIIAARENVLLFAIGVLVVLLVILFYSMTRITRYFKEARAGVGRLLEAGSGKIILSPEMDFMEAELNRVKNELARRETEARDAEQRKNDLVVYLAHDIRTPLTSVVGYLNLLIEQPKMPPERRASFLEVTLESAKRLETLINQFFEITRFNLQEMVLDIQKFDLTMMLQQLAESLHPSLEKQGKRIEMDAPARLDIDGDPDKLARVFRNILKNADTYSDKDSVIKVTAKEDSVGVTVSISDTGAPIPHEELEAIFEKFYRADNARGAQTGGAGLGLAIAREIVLAHGGTISAVCGWNDVIITANLPKAGGLMNVSGRRHRDAGIKKATVHPGCIGCLASRIRHMT